VAQFRIETTDGQRRVVKAHVMRRREDRLEFCASQPGTWRTVESMALPTVARVSRRVIELNGLERWIAQPLPTDAHNAPLQ
jgi:hypothetical protein